MTHRVTGDPRRSYGAGDGLVYPARWHSRPRDNRSWEDLASLRADHLEQYGYPQTETSSPTHICCFVSHKQSLRKCPCCARGQPPREEVSAISTMLHESSRPSNSSLGMPVLGCASFPLGSPDITRMPCHSKVHLGSIDRVLFPWVGGGGGQCNEGGGYSQLAKLKLIKYLLRNEKAWRTNMSTGVSKVSVESDGSVFEGAGCTEERLCVKNCLRRIATTNFSGSFATDRSCESGYQTPSCVKSQSSQ